MVSCPLGRTTRVSDGIWYTSEDDFAAFRAYAQSIGTAEVSIVLADPIQAQRPAAQAEVRTRYMLHRVFL